MKLLLGAVLCGAAGFIGPEPSLALAIAYLLFGIGVRLIVAAWE